MNKSRAEESVSAPTPVKVPPVWSDNQQCSTYLNKSETVLECNGESKHRWAHLLIFVTLSTITML